MQRKSWSDPDANEEESEEESEEEDDNEEEYIMNKEDSSTDDDDEDWNADNSNSRSYSRNDYTTGLSKSRSVARRQPNRTTKAQSEGNKLVYAEDEYEDDEDYENEFGYDSGNSRNRQKKQENRNIPHDSMSEEFDSGSSDSSSQSGSYHDGKKKLRNSRGQFPSPEKTKSDTYSNENTYKGKNTKKNIKKQKNAVPTKESKFVLLEYDEEEILSSEEDNDDDFHASDSMSESSDSLEFDDTMRNKRGSRQSSRSHKKPDYFNYSDDKKKAEKETMKRKRTKPDRFNYSDDEKKDRSRIQKTRIGKKKQSLPQSTFKSDETEKWNPPYNPNYDSQSQINEECTKFEIRDLELNESPIHSSKKKSKTKNEESSSDISSYEKDDESYHTNDSNSSSESDYGDENGIEQYASKINSYESTRKKRSNKTKENHSKSTKRNICNETVDEAAKGHPKREMSEQIDELNGFTSCSSTIDELTKHVLPRVHVCFSCNHGRSRQCFDIKTIYRASLMSASRKYKKDGNLALLQPPHFREEMSFDLLDQIVARFGKSSLVIENTSIFRNEEQYLNRRNEFDDIMDVPDADTKDQKIFRSRFEQYLLNQMGNSDILCCPICFTEAFRRLRSYCEDDDEEEEEENGELEEFLSQTRNGMIGAYKVDPMTILGSLDDEEFVVACSFSFDCIADLKLHLSSCHQVNLCAIKNERIFHNFKVRIQDCVILCTIEIRIN